MYQPRTAWAFAWNHDKPFITSIVRPYRRELIRAAVSEIGLPWRQIRYRGGRCVQVEIREVPHD